MSRTIELSDPRSLRVLAHPTRLALVGLLRQHGSLTATQAASLLGLTSGACSFHLRQLARFGLVEEIAAPGRQKPWRATADMTSWPAVSTHPEVAAALQLLNHVVAEHYADLLLRWTLRRPEEAVEWQEAAWFGDMLLRVTAEELRTLGQQIEALVAPYEARAVEQGTRPPGARLVSVLHVAIPRDPATAEPPTPREVRP